MKYKILPEYCSFCGLLGHLNGDCVKKNLWGNKIWMAFVMGCGLGKFSHLEEKEEEGETMKKKGEGHR